MVPRHRTFGAVPGAVDFVAQRQLLHRFALFGAENTGLGERGNSRESTGKAREEAAWFLGETGRF